MIDNTSYANEVADELSLTSSAHAEDVAAAAELTSAAYAEDVADAVNEGVGYTLRVCQINIGHFNMGTEAGVTSTPNTTNVQINSAYSDGYPSSTRRNYGTQLGRWNDRINGINADIIGMPEYNTYFGWLNGAAVTTVESQIFKDYNLSVGKLAASGWWQNTLASKYAMSNANDENLGSASGAEAAYVHEAHVTINGHDVVIAVTHLNWNRTQVHHDSRVNNEIPALVNRYKNLDYVILFGDFNTDGEYGGVKDPSNKTGLAEFQPFIEAGFTLANSMERPLLTSPATDSRPDQVSAAGWPLTPFAYLDNIIVKGFTIKNVRVIDDGTITDHCAVVADLTIIED